MKVHLVDGTYELFRAFYAVPSKRTAEGREVGATSGLVRSLRVLIREERVTHLACAFDHVIESFRNRLYEGYKTGEGVDPELLAQFPLAEEAVRAEGIVVWPMVEFEADDALATAARRFDAEPSVEQVVICSPDKDLAQCVTGSRVVCLNRRNGVYLDEAGVRQRFGAGAESIPDFLALVGDSADGIPGIRRWGASTTSRVLARYPHLEDIPKDPREWQVSVRGAAALAENLQTQFDRALLYRRLATLRLDVPLAEDIDDLKL